MFGPVPFYPFCLTSTERVLVYISALHAEAVGKHPPGFRPYAEYVPACNAIHAKMCENVNSYVHLDSVDGQALWFELADRFKTSLIIKGYVF
jgi:hypothetical protein